MGAMCLFIRLWGLFTVKRVGAGYDDDTAKLFFLLLVVIDFSSYAHARGSVVPSTRCTPCMGTCAKKIVSRGSAVHVRLARRRPVMSLGGRLGRGPFDFSPSLGKGTC